MQQDVTPIYCVPGLAADVSIFKYLQLPETEFVLHTIAWKIPKPKETMASYAARMCDEITHENPILLGVSFGGIMVQEMSNYLNVKKVVIVSSVKSRQELPTRMRVIAALRLYKLLPTSLVAKVKDWRKVAIGDFAKKRAELYQEFLGVRDKRYLNWAIKHMVSWNQDIPDPKVLHIHGNQDIILPITKITNCEIVPDGTHIMIVNRARWFNENLPALLRS